MTRARVPHVDDARAVGRRLREARERASLSQRQLAFAGCSPAYLSRIEAGERTPSLQLVRELARRLGVSEEWLATGKEQAGEEGDRMLEAEVALRMDDTELAEQLFRAELDSASEAKRRALALEGLGQLAYRRGEPREAIDLLEEALSLHGDDVAGRSGLANTLGRAYAATGQLESTIALFERFLRVAEERHDQLDAARFAVLLAYALVDSGNFGRAEELLGGVLARAEALDRSTLLGVYWAQCRLHILQHDSQNAERYARRVLALLEVSEDSFYLARAHRLMAHVDLDRGRPEHALDHLRTGLSILGESGNALEEASFRIDEARALAELGEREQAADLAMAAAGTLAEGNPAEAGRSYALIAHTFAAAGDRARAIELYELACEFLERSPTRYLIDAYARLAELLEEEGRNDQALAVLKRAVRVQAEVGRPLTPG